MPFPAHIQIGVLQRSKGRTLLHDAAYRMCERVTDIFGKTRDYSGSAQYHRGSTVLLPSHADDSLSDPWALLGASAFMERRHDAQEGRTLVISVPRVVPSQLVACVTAYAIAPLVRLGMVVQVDVHEPDASDGHRHPHIHAWIAQRRVGGAEFGRKERSWNALFVREVTALRADISTRMNQALVMLGIREVIDPRSSKEAGCSPALPRLSARHFRQRKRGQPVPEIDLQRTVRRDEPEPSTSVPWIAPIANRQPKADAPGSSSASPASKAIAEICGAWRDRGDCTFRTQFGSWGIVLADGCRIVATPWYIRSLSDTVSPTATKLMVELASAMGWTAVALDGTDAFVDGVVGEALVQRSKLMPVNRTVSEAALENLSKIHRGHLAEEIGWMDRTGALARSLDQHFASDESVDREAALSVVTETEFHPETFPQPLAAIESEDQRPETAGDLWRMHVLRILEIGSSAFHGRELPERDQRPLAERKWQASDP